jgi:hypothetical protein
MICAGSLPSAPLGRVARQTGLNIGDFGQKAADRFDRIVNAPRAARGLFGLRRPARNPP